MSVAGSRRPLLCLVTPGLSASPSSALLDEHVRVLTSLVEQAVAAGIDLVQIREPYLPARALFAVTDLAVKASRGTPARIVVNDRVDVAVVAGAGGVHLGGRSLAPRSVRQMAPRPFLVGRSVHSVDEARALTEDEGADYLIAGTVFRSASKPGDTPLLGVDGLSAIVKATTLPVLAIGGVDLTNAAAVARTGAAGFAAIRLFADAAAASGLTDVVHRARSAFDTTRVIP